MLMPRRIALTVVMLAAASMAQVNTPASAIRMPHISFVSTRAMNVFAAIAHEYRVVIGVYGVLLGADNRTVNGNNVTLAQVLDDIVAQDPRLEWSQENDGAIHVRVKGIPLSLMAVTIQAADAEGRPILEVAEVIGQFPEVHQWLQTHNCLMDQMTAVVGKVPDQHSFSLHLKNKPVWAVLDRIALRSETYFWSAIEYSRSPCAISIQ